MRVRAAAIRLNGVVHELEPPKRHHHIIGMLAKSGLPLPIRGEQGFVLEDGTFVDRREALEHAYAAGQISRERAEHGLSALYSEDLW